MKKLLFSGIAFALSFGLQAQDVCTGLVGAYFFNNSTSNHLGNEPFTFMSYGTGANGAAQGSCFINNQSAGIANLPVGNSERTISFYAVRGGLASDQTIFYTGSNSNGGRFGMYVSVSGNLVFQGYGTGFDFQVSNGMTYSQTWFHVALVYTGTQVKVYVNGSLADEETLNLNTGSSAFLILGNLNGYIDDLRIYDRALTAADVAALITPANYENDCNCNVYIPDANFRNYLLNQSSINTNNDNEISCDEASAFTGEINVHGNFIYDLTGIEAFTNITRLYCGDNYLDSLNVSSNTALQELRFGPNLFTSLDVSNMPNLERIYSYNFANLQSIKADGSTHLESISISGSPISTLANVNLDSIYQLYLNEADLESIDLTNSPKLNYLSLRGNQLTEIDLTQNPLLYELSLGENQIQNLDLSANPLLEMLELYDNDLYNLNLKSGGNENIQYLYTLNNPNLSCIQVDDSAYSVANWPRGDWNNEDPFVFDSTHYFSNNCEIQTNGIAQFAENNIEIYPNPATDKLYLEMETAATVSILNLFGQIVSTEKLTPGLNTIEVNQFENGVYLISFSNGNSIKFIKQ